MQCMLAGSASGAKGGHASCSSNGKHTSRPDVVLVTKLLQVWEVLCRQHAAAGNTARQIHRREAMINLLARFAHAKAGYPLTKRPYVSEASREVPGPGKC